MPAAFLSEQEESVCLVFQSQIEGFVFLKLIDMTRTLV